MIILKSPAELDIMRSASRIVAEVHERLKEHVTPGVTTYELDRLSEEWTLEADATPAFKGYRGYPWTLCISVNEEVVHGMPSKKRVLKDGDIVGLDFGVIYKGFYGDAARTRAVGTVSDDARDLMKVTRESLYKGIEAARPGNRVGDIGHAVQTHAEAAGYTIVRDFVGHGIGTHLHEDPQIPNYGQPNKGRPLKAGMVIAIEPMVNLGGPEVYITSDGWTAVTVDGKLSAHWEHTIAITDQGPEILTVV